ncbi:MAG: hypothetical protein HY042_01250 [Spirochaetia bacterium]|nr:hypothetical protein [Spirochaetia bacterium]
MSTVSYLIEVEDPASLERGIVVRRVTTGKIHQGMSGGLSEDGNGLILVDVIDLEARAYLTAGGVVRFQPGERFYRHAFSFRDSPVADAALAVVTEWVLFRDSPGLQAEILEFVKNCFSPEHILDLKKTDALPVLFVPIQQRFKIGRFTEKIDYDAVRRDRFRQQLDAMGDGKHMTYVAFIPNDTNHEPLFYSFGTKPHQETTVNLRREEFGFRPMIGGHIKAVVDNDGKRRFIVDAGSNYLGVGQQTPLSVAENVVAGLKLVYPEFEFIPVPGRDAFGIQQSY